MASETIVRQQRDVAMAREKFLRDDTTPTGNVREVILASWRRSRSWHVPVERMEPAHDTAADLQPKLAHCAAPVLREFGEGLGDAPTSLILTDRHGVVLDRATGNTALRQRLDAVCLAPGFSYAEDSVGTNGIGTTLERGAPAQVFGHEHYAGHLDQLACAGVPIRHPVTGALEGVIDVTCWRSDSGPLMMALAQTMAGRITAAVLDHSGVRETALLREYLHTCHRTNSAVIGFSAEVVMLNNVARQLLEPADETVILGAIAEVSHSHRPTIIDLSLPGGTSVRLQCRPAWCDAGPAGTIAQIQVTAAAAIGSTVDQRLILPGIVGSGALWERCSHDVDRTFLARDWLVLDGEGGVGKCALARAVHRRHNPDGHLRILGCPQEGNPADWLRELRAELVAGNGTLILRHLSCLDTITAVTVDEILAAHDQAQGPWVVATIDVNQTDRLGGLLRRFPRSIHVPPLRHHLEDIRELVPFLLLRLSRGAALSCSSEALRLLMRTQWPGNIRQLSDTLREVSTRRRSGMIGAQDLPPSCRGTARRLLTTLESMQRDAIVRALIDADGSKSVAARALGMSRATIYRKIHEFGITTAL